MTLDRNKLYSLIITACAAGYIWLYFSTSLTITQMQPADACLLKYATNIPCPSCGTTRSVVLLTKGHLAKAFYLNPIGYLVATIMIIAPIWIVIDIVKGQKTFFDFYRKIEIYIRKPRFAIPLILLVVMNWIWNVTKGL
jgi:hypothetical protein